MFVDWAHIGNAAIFGGLLLWLMGDSLGWFSSGSSDAPPEEPGPDYMPEDYSEEVIGTAGNDTIIIDEDTEAASDKAYLLGPGNDYVDLSNGNEFADGGAGDDELILREGDDIAVGGPGNDAIYGGIGDDEHWGQAGDDSLFGSLGNDFFHGGSGSDTVTGGGGDDTVLGGLGNDVLSGDLLESPGSMGRGIDVLDGGEGDDHLFLGDGDQGTGGAGHDHFELVEIETPDAGPVLLTDFNDQDDSLQIDYYAKTDPGTGAPLTPEVTLSYSDEDDMTSVMLDGVVLANINGQTGLQPEDVELLKIET